MTSTNWVIGASGLLGSAMVRLFERESQSVFAGPAVAWGTSQSSRDLEAGLAGLVDAAGASDWQIYWCAGAGVTDSDPVRLEDELASVREFVDSIRRLAPAVLARGSMVFASSAGAVYGGSTGAPFSEDSTPAPLGRYGVMKLCAEGALRELSETTGFGVFVGRIANIYGPGQSLVKRQGLVSMLCFSAVTRAPISIFVSLDTLRDFIFVDDCARLLGACGQRLRSRSLEDRWHLKIIASGNAVSVGALVGHFRQVSGPKPLIVMGASSAAALQGSDLRLRSIYWTDLDRSPVTTISAGIRRTIDDMRLTWLQPGLLAPAAKTAAQTR